MGNCSRYFGTGSGDSAARKLCNTAPSLILHTAIMRDSETISAVLQYPALPSFAS